ncbi:MAG TPA: serine hydrolase [Noviherbaspirillum sp.]
MSYLRKGLTATLGMLALLLAGCGGSSSSIEVSSSLVASPGGPNCLFNASSADCAQVVGDVPYVLYSSRSDGAVDAAVNTDIVAVLSEPLDPASVTTSSITVTANDGTSVAGSTEYDATRNALVFRQSQDLGAKRYTATVASSIRDASGNPMGRAYSWSFTVKAARRDTDAQRAVQQILDKAAYTYRIPGSIIAIRDDQGNTWATTNGYADLTTRAPITTDMLFRIGSNTKTFVGTLILQLADAGKLNLDAPVNTYLGAEMSAYMSAYDGSIITVRHLLNHTSGIFNFTADPAWGNAFISEPYKQYFPQELLILANNRASAPNAPVFGSFSYSNTNYILLGLIIKKVSGMAYEEAVANGITIPYGLSGTVVPRIGDTTIPAPYSRGYWEDGETGTLHDVTVRDSSTVWASGNMISTIGDLAKWGELLGKGTLLTSGMQAQRLQLVPMNDHLSYGLGVVKDVPANLVGHQGGMVGYTSQTYYVPDKGYTLAFFYNRTLALHDYSDVMTYQAISALWPTRTATAAAQRFAPQRIADPTWKPGFLMEY